MWWLRSDDDWRRRRDYCEDQKTRNFSDIDTTFVLIKLHWRRSISMKLKWSWGSVGSKKKGDSRSNSFPFLVTHYTCYISTYLPFFSATFTCSLHLQIRDAEETWEPFFLSQWAFLFLHFLCKLIHRFVDFVIFSGEIFQSFRLFSSSCYIFIVEGCQSVYRGYSVWQTLS